MESTRLESTQWNLHNRVYTMESIRWNLRDGIYTMKSTQRSPHNTTITMQFYNGHKSHNIHKRHGSHKGHDNDNGHKSCNEEIYVGKITYLLATCGSTYPGHVA